MRPWRTVTPDDVDDPKEHLRFLQAELLRTDRRKWKAEAQIRKNDNKPERDRSTASRRKWSDRERFAHAKRRQLLVCIGWFTNRR